MKSQKISKERILEIAKALFVEKGYQATSIRKIATALGISPTTIYLYYKDKADIMHALHQEGFKLLNQKFETLDLVESPFERLKAMGHCYIEFAIENPGFYEIMFMMKEPLTHLQETVENNCPPEWKEGENAIQTLIKTVEDCIKEGYFKGYHAPTLALLLWSNMHGLCALKNSSHLSLIGSKIMEKEENSNEIMQNSFNIYVRMLENI